MEAKVIGIQSGISKKGNNYTIIHYTSQSDNVNGLRASNSFLPQYIDAAMFKVGKSYDLQFLDGKIAMAQELNH